MLPVMVVVPEQVAMVLSYPVAVSEVVVISFHQTSWVSPTVILKHNKLYRYKESY